MIVENNFPNDSRVRKEAEVLKTYYEVTVISLKNRKSEKIFEVLNDIRIFRIPELPSFHLGKLRYIIEYLYFTMASAVIFIASHFFRRYKVIHVHNPPDTLFIVGILGKLFGVKFIFDHHDLAPELYLTRFSGSRDIVYKVLILCEKLSCKLANVVICTNESYKSIEMTRHAIKSNKVYIVRNNPILEECTAINDALSLHSRGGEKKRLLFLGSINPQDGLDILLHALHYLVNDLNHRDFTCIIVGDGDSLSSVKLLAKDLDIMEFIEFKGKIFDRDQVRKYLSMSDIGLEPAPENELNKHSTFIKVMEYMAAGKPIVAFDLKETRYSADGSALLVAPGDIAGFARAIKRLIDEPQLREEMGNLGREKVSSELTWRKASIQLVEAYKILAL